MITIKKIIGKDLGNIKITCPEYEQYSDPEHPVNPPLGVKYITWVLYDNVTVTTTIPVLAEMKVGDNIPDKYNDIPLNDLREGFTFDGWYTLPNGGGDVVTSDTEVYGQNPTFYAKWTETQPDNPGGGDDDDPTVEKVTVQNLTGEELKLTGKSNNSVVTIASNATQEVDKGEYTISQCVSGGVKIGEVKKVQGDTVTINENVIFNKWVEEGGEDDPGQDSNKMILSNFSSSPITFTINGSQVILSNEDCIVLDKSQDGVQITINDCSDNGILLSMIYDGDIQYDLKSKNESFVMMDDCEISDNKYTLTNEELEQINENVPYDELVYFQSDRVIPEPSEPSEEDNAQFETILQAAYTAPEISDLGIVELDDDYPVSGISEEDELENG